MPTSTRAKGDVLNALRHRGDRQHSALPLVVLAALVLNALRHRGDRQSRGTFRGSHRPRCAQRLTASWRQAIHSDGEFGINAATCSTPYGIVATGKRPQAKKPGGLLRVLNALRHRGDRQRSRARRSGRNRGCAQRLTASWRQANSTEIASYRTPCCAQRLTASWRQAKRRRDPVRHRQDVLNALRHRGDRQTWGAGNVADPERVLNALRHRGDRQMSREESENCQNSAQRLTASWRQAIRASRSRPATVVRCSTPYGIVATGK